MTSNRTQPTDSFGRAISRLDKAAAFATLDPEALVREKDIPLRTAAYALALNRIGQAVEPLGTHVYFGNDSEPGGVA